MNRVQYDDIVNELTRIAIGYGKKFDSHQVDFYMRVLRQHEHGMVMAALHESVSACKHMPRPADIVEIIKANREKTSYMRQPDFVNKGAGRPWNTGNNSQTECHSKIAKAWMIYQTITGLHKWTVDVKSIDQDEVCLIVNQQAQKHGIHNAVFPDHRISQQEINQFLSTRPDMYRALNKRAALENQA